MVQFVRRENPYAHAVFLGASLLQKVPRTIQSTFPRIKVAGVKRSTTTPTPLRVSPTPSHARAESEASPLRQKLSDIAALRRHIALQQWRMVFYLPNAVHWAFYKPPAHPLLVAIFGLAEAAVGIVQAFPPSEP